MLRPDAIPPASRHGGDGPAVAAALGCSTESLLDLSQTLNPFAPDIMAIAASHLASLRTYPDQRGATALLADAMGVDPGRLLLTNGGSQAIALVSSGIGGTVRSEPEFALHPRSGYGPIWRSDPHSPSGVLASEDEEADVWDEAFLAMSTGTWTRQRSGVIVGSLTKLFACPGLRLGYVVADNIEPFRRAQPEWSISSLALAALPDLLASADLPGWAHAIAEARAATAKVFTNRGISATTADAPWVLVHAPGLREQLISLGIVVRDCANFAMPEMARVAVADEAGRSRLAAALDQLAST